MVFPQARIACCMAALALLWGCVPSELQTAGSLGKNDTPIGEFFRTAATTSQAKFDYQSAAKYYQNLYNRDPDDAGALLGLVRNLRYIGSARQSLNLLEEAMPRFPDEFALRAEFGKSLVASGSAREAVKVLNELLEEAPGDWELLSALGIAYDFLDKPDKAVRAYRAALEITPLNTSVINNLALSLALAGKIDDGIALLEDARVNTFATPHIRQNLALMYAMKGDIKAARKLAERDLTSDMVENNIKYYERLFASAKGAPSNRNVEVSRLEEPGADPVEPVFTATSMASAPQPATEESPDTMAMAAVNEAVDMEIAGIKVQLGVFKTRERATAGLSALRDGNVDLLSGLRFAIDEVEGIDAPIGYMVLAGPLASQQMAADLCTKLHSRKKICRLVLP